MGGAVLLVAIGWAAGVAPGPLPGLSASVLVLAGGAVLVGALLARAGVGRLLALAVLALVLGQLRVVLAVDAAPPDALTGHLGLVALTGRVVEAPIPRGGRVEAVLEVEAIGDVESPGERAPLAEPRPRVLLRAPTVRAGYGDRIETRGRLARPRSRPGWPFADILARRGIHWVVDTGGVRVIEPSSGSLLGVLMGVRGSFEANTRAILPEPQASLVAGIVFGAQVGLPPDLKAAMSATGTSHLTAVSGANVAIVAGALTVLAGRFLGRAPAALVAAVGVWLYTLLVGAPPSAVRAATMASFALAAYGLGRQPDAIVGLVVAVALLLGWDPGLASDLGFQLSVTATAGLILLSPSIERRLAWLPRQLRGHLAVGIAAQAATLPILLGTFQRLSPISLPANVVAAPLISPIMALGAALAALGFLPGIGDLLGWAVWAPASALLWVIEQAARLPGATIAVGRAPAWLPFVWYAGLGCWAASGSSDARALGLRPGWLRTAAVALALLTGAWIAAGALGVGRSVAVEVALLDVEPAAAFIRLPSGQGVLVMAGAPGIGLAASVGGQLDFADGAVDVVIGPGGIRTGIDLLELSRAGTEGQESDATTHPVTPLDRGALVDLGSGVTVQVVDVRQAGQVTVLDLAITVNDLAILLPGPGAPSGRWGDVAPDLTTVGRLPASGVAWARALPARPWLLLVGEPALERVRGDSGVPFLTRREHGQIELSILDGAVSVETERCAEGEACQVALPPPTSTVLRP